MAHCEFTGFLVNGPVGVDTRALSPPEIVLLHFHTTGSNLGTESTTFYYTDMHERYRIWNQGLT